MLLSFKKESLLEFSKICKLVSSKGNVSIRAVENIIKGNVNFTLYYSTISNKDVRYNILGIVVSSARESEQDMSNTLPKSLDISLDSDSFYTLLELCSGENLCFTVKESAIIFNSEERDIEIALLQDPIKFISLSNQTPEDTSITENLKHLSKYSVKKLSFDEDSLFLATVVSNGNEALYSISQTASNFICKEVLELRGDTEESLEDPEDTKIAFVTPYSIYKLFYSLRNIYPDLEVIERKNYYLMLIGTVATTLQKTISLDSIATRIESLLTNKLFKVFQYSIKLTGDRFGDVLTSNKCSSNDTCTINLSKFDEKKNTIPLSFTKAESSLKVKEKLPVLDFSTPEEDGFSEAVFSFLPAISSLLKEGNSSDLIIQINSRIIKLVYDRVTYIIAQNKS